MAKLSNAKFSVPLFFTSYGQWLVASSLNERATGHTSVSIPAIKTTGQAPPLGRYVWFTLLFCATRLIKGLVTVSRV